MVTMNHGSMIIFISFHDINDVYFEPIDVIITGSVLMFSLLLFLVPGCYGTRLCYSLVASILYILFSDVIRTFVVIHKHRC